MSFELTSEQSMLRDTLRSYLDDRYDAKEAHRAAGSERGWLRSHWQAFATDLGILGASFSEQAGGMGGGATENAIILEQLGESRAIEPYLGTVVIGGGFLKYSPHSHAADLIAGIIEGQVVFAFAYAEPQGRYNWADLTTTARRSGGSYVINGKKSVVIGAPWASHLIVTARTSGAQRERQGVSTFLVEAGVPGLVRRDFRTIDGQSASEISFQNVTVPIDHLIGDEGGSLPLIERVIDEATAGVCSEAVGVMRRMHSDTLAYTKQRRQFGRAISEFQVLQHRMVDMMVYVEHASSIAQVTTAQLGKSPTERAIAVSSAKAYICQASRFVGQNAIQLHGGVGTTDDLDIGHYFKRAIAIEKLFGSLDHHLARYERLTFQGERTA